MPKIPKNRDRWSFGTMSFERETIEKMVGSDVADTFNLLAKALYEHFPINYSKPIVKRGKKLKVYSISRHKDDNAEDYHSVPTNSVESPIFTLV